ncbi:hypothetical protein LTR53_004434 [Teratosphaeriaceae sp. CCFEE 6253]|nr:hypothetical protein LTR53_004434 [Teratosphaeriaceae sp. CCFEE 6253]
MASSGIHEEDFDGSDHESLYADSPTDGYFTQREHPTETFVEQSSVQAESEAKAREAAEDRDRAAPQAATPPSQRSPTSSTRSPIWADESTPLLDAGPAPPDYATATAGRRQSASLAERPASAQESASTPLFQPSNYGSIDRSTRTTGSRTHRTRSTRSSRSSTSTDRHVDREWPFGSRNNPFGANFPYGANGSPFGANFPFGPNGPFGAGGPPQSMGGMQEEGDHADEEGGNGRRSKVKNKNRWWKKQRPARYCSPVRLINIFLGIAVIGLIVLLARLTREASRVGKSPVKEKEPDTHGRLPNVTAPPTPGPDHPHSEVCPFKWYSDAMFFDFDHPNNFSFSEIMDPAIYMTGGISGSVWIFPAPAEQEVDIRVWISYASTEPWSVNKMDYGYSAGALQLRFPQMAKSDDTQVLRPCLDVSVGIYVKTTVALDNLAVTTQHLDIQAGQGASGFSRFSAVSQTWAVDSAAFTSEHGSVKMAIWHTRETRIETRSGSIGGSYGLGDLLSVRTRSGGISIKVSPRPASPAHPMAPAVLDAESESGSVHIGVATTPETAIPDRDYQTRVTTRSGTISGTFVFSSVASFTSRSGALALDLLPYFDRRLDERVTASLRTESGSAATTLRLLDPVRYADTPVTNILRSIHKTSSGSLNLVYPQSWEGAIQGGTRSGGISVVGRDVTVFYEGRLGEQGGKRVVARKGYGDSHLDFVTGSGAATLRMGDL